MSDALPTPELMPSPAPVSPAASPRLPGALQTPAASRTRYGLWLRVFMVILILWPFWKFGIHEPLTVPGVDYGKHWDAAVAVLEGRSAYIGGDLWIGFNYPQASALVFSWLGLFDKDTGEMVWKATLLALLAGTAIIGWRGYRPGPISPERLVRLRPLGHEMRAGAAQMWGLIAVCIVSSYLPATSCNRIGNIDPVNAILAVAVVAALLAGHERRGGALWAMLVLVKMVPLALLVPIVLWRRWRILQGFALAMVIYFFILLALGRVGDEWYFVREMMPIVPRWWRSISISPILLVARATGLAAMSDNPYGFAVIVRNAVLLLGTAYVALNAWLWRRGTPWWRGLETAIICYPILSPLLEYHHFVWILPVLLLQVRRWTQGEMSTPLGLAYVFGWLLLNAGYHASFLLPTIGDWCHFGALPGYLFLMALSIADVVVTGRPCGNAAEKNVETIIPCCGSAAIEPST